MSCREWSVAYSTKARMANRNASWYTAWAVLARPKCVSNLRIFTGISKALLDKVLLRLRFLISRRFWGVFEVDASSRAAAEKDFGAIADKAKRKATFDNGMEFLKESRDGWLLILDNADNRKVPVQSLFPPTNRGCILITTRNNRLVVLGTAGHYELGPMDVEQSITLFLKEALKDPDDQSHRREAERIVEELGRLPLALTQAAVPIRRKLCRLEDFREYFNKNKLKLMTTRPLEEEDDTYKYSVYTSLELSLQTITTRSKEIFNVASSPGVDRALEILQICSCLHFQDIPEEIFNVAPSRKDQGLVATVLDYIHSVVPFDRLSGRRISPRTIEEATTMDREGIRQALSCIRSLPDTPVAERAEERSNENKDALSLLDSSSLGKFNLDTGLFSIHPLVHEWSLFRLSRREKEWARWSAGVALTHSITWHRLTDSRRRLLSHVDFYLSTGGIGGGSGSGSLTADQARAAAKFALVYQDNGKYPTAQKLSEESLEGVQASLGEDDPNTLRSLNNLAVVLEMQREHGAAAELSRRAWEKRKSALGEKDKDTLESLSNYALSLHGEGYFLEAEKMNRQCLKAREEALGPDTAATIESFNNLALTLLRQSNHGEAVKLLSRALEWREKKLGLEHPDTIQSLGDLAIALRDGSEVEEAAKKGRQALEMRRRVLGNNHPDTLVNMTELASILRKLGHIAEAEGLSKEAETGMKQYLGSTNPDTLDSLNELASACADLGDLEKAEGLYRTVLHGYEKHFSASHSNILRIMTNLGGVLGEREQYDEAEALYRRALAGFLAQHQPDHDDVVKCKISFTYLLMQQDKYDETEVMYRDIEDCLERSHPGPHDLKAECFYSFAIFLRQRKKYEEAEEKAWKAVEAFEKTLGLRSSAVMDSLAILAFLHDLQQKYLEAWPLYRRALDGYAALGGPPTLQSRTCRERFEAMCEQMRSVGIPEPTGKTANADAANAETDQKEPSRKRQHEEVQQANVKRQRTSTAAYQYS
jgi:tetratricopeptide (TPR) repeat protein